MLLQCRSLIGRIDLRPGMPLNSPARKLTSSVLSWPLTLPLALPPHPARTRTHGGAWRDACRVCTLVCVCGAGRQGSEECCVSVVHGDVQCVQAQYGDCTGLYTLHVVAPAHTATSRPCGGSLGAPSVRPGATSACRHRLGAGSARLSPQAGAPSAFRSSRRLSGRLGAPGAAGCGLDSEATPACPGLTRSSAHVQELAPARRCRRACLTALPALSGPPLQTCPPARPPSPGKPACASRSVQGRTRAGPCEARQSPSSTRVSLSPPPPGVCCRVRAGCRGTRRGPGATAPGLLSPRPGAPVAAAAALV